MDSLHWQRLEEVFHAVADLPPGAVRDAQLATLCGDDHELADDVRTLLIEDGRLQAVDAAGDPHVGLRLGSYEVGALIARGGMAAVYSAHRADAQFQQRVAIKIMDLRLSDPALVAQFKAERQILAALEHPALTRLLDGGVTPLGEPYLVMEYVEGESIDRYCDAQRLDLAARVRLFLQVCAGVAFAHRNLVLHRDLKPSNLLVTTDGHVRVVDFGTATLLQPERLATISRAPLTPAYASPEQLTGGAVGTASDQYSLGLVLYEILTGVIAFAARTSMMGAVERALAGEEPTAPHAVVATTASDARRTTLPRLRRQLSGDLGTIVRKALAADPAARYPSVQHLAEDLQRWLAGEPILGKPASLVYRTSRFVQRHRVSVAVAAALFAALVAATIVSLRQADIARAETAKTRQLNSFLTTMLSAANPTWTNANAASAGSITVRQVLDGASELIGPELSNAPEVEAEMRRTLGQTYNALGAVDQALPHVERALALYRERGDDAGAASATGILASNRMLRGDFKTSEALGRQVVAYLRAHPSEVDPKFLTGMLADLGAAIAYQRIGDPEGLALMREAIALGDRHALAGRLSAVIRQNLSIQLIRIGQTAEAETLLREAQRQWDADSSPSAERYSGMRNLAVLLYQRGEYAEAEQLAGKAAEGYARAMPANHPLQPNFKVWWGRTLLAAGHIDRARPVVMEAYASYTRNRPAGHLELALPLIALGSLHRADGRLQQAEQALREARAILAKNPSSRDRGADAAGELGLTLSAMGRDAEAKALLKESHDTLLALYGAEHPLTQQALARLQASQ